MTAHAFRKPKDTAYYIHSFIALLLMFGIGYLPPSDPLTSLGMKVLGIFIGLLYAWTFVEMIWPSLVGLIALGLTGYAPMKTVFTSGFGNDLVLLVFFLLIFAAYLDESGLNRAIANWFVSRRIGVGRPWIFSTLILLATYVLAATISFFASIVLMWNIFYEISDTLGFKRRDNYPAMMLIGIVFAAMLGLAIFPYKTIPVMVMGSLEKISGITVDFISFTLVSFTISIICLALYILTCKYIFRPDVTPLKHMTAEQFAHMRGASLTSPQKIAAVFLASFIVLMFLPSFIPADTWLGGILKTMGTTGLAAFVVAIAAFLRIEGKRVLDFGRMISRGMLWDIIILFAVTMPLGSALESDETGVMAFIVHILKPLFAHTGGTLFIALFILIAGVLTQFAHNLVLAAVLLPILYSFSVELGANPAVGAVLLAFTVGVAIVTPGSSAQGAMIHGNKQWISTKQAYLYGITTFIITSAILLLVGLPLGSLLL